MKLEELTVDLLKKVVEIYNQKAYPGFSGKKVVDLPPDASLEEILDFFEEKPSKEGEGLRRYAVALGNINYPRMKLVFQEHLFPGEFCFVVDTHDDMEMPPNAPDIEAWLALKQTNRRLKLEIEEAWEEAGIPTQQMLVRLAEELKNPQGPSRGKSILVADDEKSLAKATVEMLRKHGYRVWAVFDGEAALAEVREKRPDLLVIDNEMPKLSGMKVIEELKKDRSTRSLPVLLMTGGPISLSEKERAAGFLCKPFSEKLLVSVVHHLLGEEREEEEAAGEEMGGGLGPEDARKDG